MKECDDKSVKWGGNDLSVITCVDAYRLIQYFGYLDSVQLPKERRGGAIINCQDFLVFK